MKKYWLLAILLVMAILLLTAYNHFSDDISLIIKDPIPKINLGILEKDKSYYLDSTSNRVFLNMSNDNINIDMNYFMYDSNDQLQEALKDGEINFVASSSQLEFDQTISEALIESETHYSLYSRVKTSHVTVDQIRHTKIGYVNDKYMDYLVSSYYQLEIEDQHYDDMENMFRFAAKDELDFIFVADEGKCLFGLSDERWYRVKSFDQLLVQNFVYFDKKYDSLFDLWYTWYNNYKNKQYEKQMAEVLIENNQKLFVDSLTFDEKIYLSTVDTVKVVTLAYDAPLYYDDTGILVEVVEYMNAITGISFDIVSQNNDQVDFDGQQTLYTNRVSQYLESDQAFTEIPFITSSILIVGNITNRGFADLDDLALEQVAVINNVMLSRALRVMYPNIEVIDYSSPNEAADAIRSGEVLCALIDEYEYHYLQISKNASELTILDYYNHNNAVDFIAYDMDSELVSIVEKALNRLDETDILQQSIHKIIIKENRIVERSILYGLIFILGMILFYLMVRLFIYRAEKRKLNYLYTHDSLTELINMNGLKEEVSDADIGSSVYSMVLVDINNFRKVNEELSYSVGSETLIHFRDLIVEELSKNDFIARNGADEYILLVKGISEERVHQLYRNLTLGLSGLLDMDMTLTVGVSKYHDGDLLDEVFTQAEQALLKQKEKGEPGIIFYTDALREIVEKDIIYSKQINYAIQNEELKLHYQPQIDITTGKTVGLEALVRWHHPKDGILSPYHFLHIIKKEKLIKKFDYYIIEQAVRQMEAWHKNGRDSFKLAVNVTLITLMDPYFITELTQVLNRHKINRNLLCLEITEDFEVIDQRKMHMLVNSIQSLGLTIAIDDFGTGYSSLSYIIKYPINTIKIDKSLVDNITTRREDYEFLKGIVRILKELGKEIVIEGVEEIEQLEKLKIFDHLRIQGYYYSKPLCLGDIEVFIDEH